MIINAYKTHKIEANDDLIAIIDKYLPAIKENSVVAVSSKIVSLCEGSIIKKQPEIKKEALVKQECSLYFDGRKAVKHGIIITIKDSILAASSGIDESNGKGVFILWPKNPFESCSKIWDFLKKKNNIKNLGVIITDSRSSPMRYGVLGVGIAWCGIKPLFDYGNAPDIWEQGLQGTLVNHLDALSVSAVYEMGEGAEQTPLCVISDIKKIIFTENPPSLEEIEAFKINIEADLYSPLLKSVKWEKGGDA